MSERTTYLLIAVLAGGAIPVQVAVNTLLRRYVGEPMQVTFVSYFAGTLASLAICVFRGTHFLVLLLLLKRHGGCG